MRQNHEVMEYQWSSVASSPFQNPDFQTAREIDINKDVCLVEKSDIIVPLIPQNLIQEITKEVTEVESIKQQKRELIIITDPSTGENYELGFCPNCGVATVKPDGCNYMKCDQGDRSMIPKEFLPKTEELCQQEWCWSDGLPKYRPIPGKEYLGYCDDKTHNSH